MRRSWVGVWLAAPLLAPGLAAAAPPTPVEIEASTRPLIEPRLRLPQSLHAFAVTRVAPTPDDPQRYAVVVRFRARTPFGRTTEHTASFHMKRATTGDFWVVTAQP